MRFVAMGKIAGQRNAARIAKEKREGTWVKPMDSRTVASKAARQEVNDILRRYRRLGEVRR